MHRLLRGLGILDGEGREELGGGANGRVPCPAALGDEGTEELPPPPPGRGTGQRRGGRLVCNTNAQRVHEVGNIVEVGRNWSWKRRR